MGKAKLLAVLVEDKVKGIVNAKLSDMTTQLTNEPYKSDNVAFLRFFRDLWISFCTQMQDFKDVFLVLERTYLVRVQNTTYWQMGLQAVKRKMNENLRMRLIDGVIDLIQQDRVDEKIENRELIAKLIHVMLALDFYRELFEPKFLDITSSFFQENAQSNFQQLNVSDKYVATNQKGAHLIQNMHALVVVRFVI